MPNAPESLPSDLAAAHAMILAEREARLAAETGGHAAKLALGIEIERVSSVSATLIRRAHQRASAAFQEVLAGDDLTPTQFAVLAILGRRLQEQ